MIAPQTESTFDNSNLMKKDNICTVGYYSKQPLNDPMCRL